MMIKCQLKVLAKIANLAEELYNNRCHSSPLLFN